MAGVVLDGVTKSYGKKRGVADLSLEVGDGEFFVVLGPSGAGKTTTLKAVAGLVELDGGRVAIGGRDMEGVQPYHRRVAMAFESYALYPQKTVSQNLASPLRSGRTGSYSESEQRTRIEAVTTTLGIDHLLERFPRELSNGQRQRVALGRVLVRPADAYLLDEPLSHLDAKLRAAMRAELKQLGSMSSTTSLYVTHDYQEALALGDRVAVLREGRLVQVGTPEDVWERPVDSFVAKALGQPEINLLDAVVDGGELVAAEGAVRVPVPRGAELRAGDRARVGIRPRDLTLVPGDDVVGGAPDRGQAVLADEGARAVRVEGRVRLAERLGRAVELEVDLGGGRHHLIAVDESEAPLAEGDAVRLAVPAARVHVFAHGAPGEDTAAVRPAAPPADGRPAAVAAGPRTTTEDTR
ncbi:ABC transporter ATP-binding protein [uncultured Pseudokineococcus sp.]|uniref:ABC transporter ATP-binding protein n=1 Tax=uncultured Pseudokineococcus sp. TaxID=1642928 RepID=UPI002635CA15|nr:ABC transporter ATP-binding protein [uncultured Pseudokineococcus sp.]